jgi:hypothetical protein
VNTIVTVRNVKGRLRVAVTQDPSTGAHRTQRFVRGWNVYVNGERSPMLYVAQDENGRMYGLTGTRIVITRGPQIASRIAFMTWQQLQVEVS